jgi:hypothetical protein
MCIRDDHRHCQELRPILEVAKNAKSSTAIVHIERDLEDIDAHLKKLSQISQIILLKLINKKEIFCPIYQTCANHLTII